VFANFGVREIRPCYSGIRRMDWQCIKDREGFVSCLAGEGMNLKVPV
jgi:hypothetical protein